MADRLEKIVTAYQDAEGWLLHLIAQAVAKGNEGTEEFYQGRLDDLREVMVQARHYMIGMEANLAEEVQEALAAGYGEGAAQAARSIPDATIPTGAVQALALETVGALSSQRNTILRAVEDGYRQVVQNVTTRSVLSGMNLQSAMQQSLDQFASRGITSFVDQSGRRWSMDTYTRMALRSAQNRATNAGRYDTFQANNVNLIRTSFHKAPAPVCEPYQGRILALDGASGERVVQDRITGEDITVLVTATLEEAEAAGYHHPNCKHIDTAYIPGMPIPDPPEVDPDDYEQTQRQRAIERNIRHWKKREAVAVTPKAKAEAKAKVKAWQKAQREHLKRHPFLRRNYDRERLYVGGSGGAVAQVKPTLPPKPPLTPTPTPVVTPTPSATPTLRTPPADTFQHAEMDISVWPNVGGGSRGKGPLSQVPTTNRQDWGEIVTDVNPGYSPGSDYEVNCVRVAHSVELRRRGYDVSAGSGEYVQGGGWGTNRFLDEVRDSRRSFMPAKSKALVSNTDVAATAWRTPEGGVRIPQQAPKAKKGVKGGQNGATLDMFERGMPDGASGWAEGDWSGRGDSGHVWNWVKEDGQIKFFEGQTGKGFIPVDSYLDQVKRGTFRMMRADDLIPTDDVLRVIDYDAG